MQHSFGLKRLGRASRGRWRAVVIGRDPGGDSCRDRAVVSPMDDEAVVVGGGGIGGGNVGGVNR
jgi:hypothetical protein